ncbi:MAG: beta-ketoacyl synthase N-terminal-like domain-containing protein, partial [Chitinophagaceae bacterium]
MRTIRLKRVVVTGMGITSPLGNALSEYWNALLEGKSGATPITLFDASKFRTKFACEVKNFDPTAFMERKEVRKMDRYCQFAVATATEAIEHSKLLSGSYNPDRVGVIVGSGIGGFTTQQEEILNFGKGDGTPKFNPFFIPKLISDIAAGQISIRYGLRGPNYAVVSACASSTHSILDAFNHIRMGKADAMISGGSEAVITESGVGGFNSLRALSERNNDPITASRPFDKDRDGFVLGEGAGVLILEELEHAKERGANIYCEI